ncbi:hypothetical protein [Pseudomonas citronellolis]|uniref:hypothetical protein n=1 Tax=Pseudomonas citronellolis TaxID=53408 RepID=UPI002FD9A08C
MKRNLWRVFRWPLALAVLSLVGLISALVGDGPWDALSWFALGIPLVVILAALARARRPSP